MEIQDVLSLSDLFQGMDPGMLAGRFVEAGPGERITDEYMGERCVGLIAAGQADVIMTAPDGTELMVNTLGPGACFGVSNLMNDRKLESVLAARTQLLLYFVPKTAVLDCLGRNPEFALRYAAFLNSRIEFLLQKIEMLTIASARGKLAAFLILHMESGGHVQLTGSREDLADRLGISRAALFRELSALQSLGIIRRERDGFSVLMPEALETYISTNGKRDKQ